MAGKVIANSIIVLRYSKSVLEDTVSMLHANTCTHTTLHRSTQIYSQEIKQFTEQQIIRITGQMQTCYRQTFHCTQNHKQTMQYNYIPSGCKKIFSTHQCRSTVKWKCDIYDRFFQAVLIDSMAGSMHIYRPPADVNQVLWCSTTDGSRLLYQTQCSNR